MSGGGRRPFCERGRPRAGLCSTTLTSSPWCVAAIDAVDPNKREDAGLAWGLVVVQARIGRTEVAVAGAEVDVDISRGCRCEGSDGSDEYRRSDDQLALAHC